MFDSATRNVALMGLGALMINLSYTLTSNIVIVGLGAVAFHKVNQVTSYFVPTDACKSLKQRWKWRNVATSLVHSAVSALWAIFSFYMNPQMLNDLILTTSISSRAVVCFSTGYFIHDSLDMLQHHRKRSSYELLLHHALVIICFMAAVSTQLCVAYVTLSLMLELNSVFLHVRQLLIITDQPKCSIPYQINSVLNISTFLCFRIVLLGWMCWWMFLHWTELPLCLQLAGFSGLTVIVVMNIVLLCRILYIDFVWLLIYPKLEEKIEDTEELKVSELCNGALNHINDGIVHCNGISESKRVIIYEREDIISDKVVDDKEILKSCGYFPPLIQD